MMQWLRRSFIAGFFVTVPLFISVAALLWLRTRTSAPLNTPASYMSVFALGGIISSPGAP